MSRTTYHGNEGDPDQMCDEGFLWTYPNKDFPHQANGLQTGYYKGAKVLGFRAGSYTGYNQWRDWLARTMLGVSAETVWRHPADFAERPFFELINFADNEGVLGPETCKRLAEAFAAHDEQAQNSGEFYDLYQTWRKAFELAADDGLVYFG